MATEEFNVGSSEARKEYWLRPEDLRTLERHTIYFGFAQGRASWYYRRCDLLELAIRKHGKERFDKKVAARDKRRAQAAARRARAEAEAKRARDGQIAITPASGSQRTVAVLTAHNAKRKAPTQQELNKPSKRAKKKDFSKLNSTIAGTWSLSLTKPNDMMGETGELVIRSIGICPGGDISLAGIYGNIHGFRNNSGTNDKTMKFETKWKTCGQRYEGTLSITVDQKKGGTVLKGKYNCGVPKRLCGVKVVEFTGTKEIPEVIVARREAERAAMLAKYVDMYHQKHNYVNSPFILGATPFADAAWKDNKMYLQKNTAKYVDMYLDA